MSENANFSEDASNRTFNAPYTARHPVPNIHGYAAVQGERQAQASEAFKSQKEADESKLHALVNTAKAHLSNHDQSQASSQEHLYSGQNRNLRPPTPDESCQGQEQEDRRGLESETHANKSDEENAANTAESNTNNQNLRENCKQAKNMDTGSEAREVTDPVTHLPVMIHDSTSRDLDTTPENERHSNSQPVAKSKEQLAEESELSQTEHRGLQRLFPPPKFDVIRDELVTFVQRAVLFGLGSLLLTSLTSLIGWQLLTLDSTRQDISWVQKFIHATIIAIPMLGVGGALLWITHVWLGHRINGAWEARIWDAARTQEQDTVESRTPESTQWLNSTLASVWSLINPDLFASLADTLEDVMQASLPKLVRMISVEDLGQGSEALRILGIRWLPTGAAAQDVSVSGKIESKNEGESGQNIQVEGEIDNLVCVSINF